MLQRVLGPAGSGKTEWVLQQAERLARSGKDAVILIPEQSSFQLEKTICLRLEPVLRDRVTVLSFSKLCGDLQKRCGGALHSVDEALRTVLVRRAVKLLEGELSLFTSARWDTGVCRTIAEAIEALKNGGADEMLLEKAAVSAEGAYSARKFSEMARILTVYNTLLHERFSDYADRLSAAAEQLRSCDFFTEKWVFLDGFNGFTEPQFAILAAIAATAEQLTVTLCLGAGELFRPTRAIAEELGAIAKKEGVEVAKDIFLPPGRRSKTPGTNAAERWFAGEPIPAAPEGVFLIRGADRYDEAAKIAAEICALVREEGYRYSEIAVCVRSLEATRAPLLRTFDRYGIPVFRDAPGNLANTPFVNFVRAAAELLGHFETNGVIRLLKTGLCGISEADADALENYAFVWSIEGKTWREPFCEDPRGLDVRDPAPSESLEAARLHLMRPLERFLESCRGKTAEHLIVGIYRLLEQYGAIERLKDADPAVLREASETFRMLDTLHDLLKGERLRPEEFSELAGLFAGTVRLGEIPEHLDEVSLGTADRMRFDAPRAVFLAGVCEGEFPRADFEAPLFTFEERDLLNSAGAKLELTFEGSLENEQLYFYRALGAPSERLYFCYPESNTGGTALLLSSEVAEFLQHNGTTQAYIHVMPVPLAATENTARREYVKSLLAGSDGGEAAAAIARSGIAGDLESVRAAAEAPDYRLRSEALCERLLGKTLSLSPTRLEQYRRCPFAYFLQDVLNIRPLRKASVDPLSAGTFVHAVLENVLRGLEGDLLSVETEELLRRTRSEAQHYITEKLGAGILEQPRMRSLLERLTAQTCRLVSRLVEEQKQSLFRPTDYELRIGRTGEVTPRALMTPSGHTVYIEGTVDRVDVMTREGKTYLRVVDYKTGEKHFSLSEVLCGLNLQMLIYLFSLCGKEGKYKGSIPAGVLYLPSDPAVRPLERGEGEVARTYRMDGLLLNDPEILRAMEREVEGLFIPATLNASGEPRKSDKLATLEEFGRLDTAISALITEMAEGMYRGEFAARPTALSGRTPCEVCGYSGVCRRDRVREVFEIDPDASKKFREVSVDA